MEHEAQIVNEAVVVVVFVIVVVVAVFSPCRLCGEGWTWLLSTHLLHNSVSQPPTLWWSGKLRREWNNDFYDETRWRKRSRWCLPPKWTSNEKEIDPKSWAPSKIARKVNPNKLPNIFFSNVCLIRNWATNMWALGKSSFIPEFGLDIWRHQRSITRLFVLR